MLIQVSPSLFHFRPTDAHARKRAVLKKLCQELRRGRRVMKAIVSARILATKIA